MASKICSSTSPLQIDPGDTTWMCSNCGSVVKKDLSVRTHECLYCGFFADHDCNATVNIHCSGVGQPFEPVEVIPLHHISVMQVLSMIAGKLRPKGAGSSPG